MEQKIPLFPLSLVPFPGENINLHIYEPRYIELFTDILQTNKMFGIPPYINKKIEFGTLMEVVNVRKKYEDGKMDIETRGLKIFKIIKYENPAKGKQYAEGYVDYIDNIWNEDPLLKINLLEKLEEFFMLIDEKDAVDLNENIKCYDFIHKLALPIEMEYEVLKQNIETNRQELILDYLDHTLPVLQQTMKAKEIIKMNGHFKYLNPINFH